MLGCDILCDRRLNDKDIAMISAAEGRTVLTRDRGLLMRKEVAWGYFIRGANSLEQWQEVVRVFAIPLLPQAFHRCLSCNGLLRSVEKDEVWESLEPKTRLYYSDFSRCDQCGKVFWEGSNYQRMRKSISGLDTENFSIQGKSTESPNQK
jgi:uncharacterized protein with PIN domain